MKLQWPPHSSSCDIRLGQTDPGQFSQRLGYKVAGLDRTAHSNARSYSPAIASSAARFSRAHISMRWPPIRRARFQACSRERAASCHASARAQRAEALMRRGVTNDPNCRTNRTYASRSAVPAASPDAPGVFPYPGCAHALLHAVLSRKAPSFGAGSVV